MLSQLEAFAGVIRFGSVAYLAFLAASIVIYFVLPGVRTRVAWLLIVSVAFFALLSPRSLAILVVTITVSYLFGLLLDRGCAGGGGQGERAWWAKPVLVVSLVLITGDLVVYKYLAYIAKMTDRYLVDSPLLESIGGLKLLLPLGISFWTFQAIAYLVDIYRGRTRAVRNPFMYTLAVSFFPVVTSGPITRVQVLTGQFAARHRFDYSKMQSALLLIGMGFFKKLMIADRLAIFVNEVYKDPRAFTSERNGLVLLIASVFFAIQLYADFSGYTDIVRGSARLFGVELPLNFRSPYFSRSVRDFWRRWHMSLMDWLRDYLYIPLGGNRKGRVRKHLNTLTVFAISGLWHGTGLTYLIWGVLNAVYTIAGELLAPINDGIARLLRVDRETFAHRLFQTLLTFMLVTVAWVFFRADSLTDALYIITNMFSPTWWVFTDQSLVRLGLTYSELNIALVSIGIVGVVEWMAQSRDLVAALNRQHLIFRWGVYYALVVSIVIFGHYGGAYSAADFVYFKF